MRREVREIKGVATFLSLQTCEVLFIQCFFSNTLFSNTKKLFHTAIKKIVWQYKEYFIQKNARLLQSINNQPDGESIKNIKNEVATQSLLKNPGTESENLKISTRFNTTDLLIHRRRQKAKEKYPSEGKALLPSKKRENPVSDQSQTTAQPNSGIKPSGTNKENKPNFRNDDYPISDASNYGKFFQVLESDDSQFHDCDKNWQGGLHSICVAHSNDAMRSSIDARACSVDIRSDLAS